MATDEQIRTRAHELWEQAAKPEGQDEEFWHRAEKEFRETEESRRTSMEPPPSVLPG
jgi:hypothetical protein